MRGLLSVLAGISGSKQFCEITRSFWWTGGDLLGWAELDWVEVTQMELMYILFLDLWILLIRLFLFRCFYIHRGIAYL